MKTMLRRSVGLCFLLGAFAPLAANPLAASGGAPGYEHAPQSIDVGGRRTTSANYTVDATLGGILGTAFASPSVTLAERRGYVAQLFEVETLIVSGPLTVSETAPATFSVRAQLDNQTLLDPPAAQIAWSFTGAGQTLSGTGEFFPAIVYFDSPARVNASWRGSGGGVDVLVLDTQHDNYGLYANDGLRDLWQVQYFGEENPLALPTLAPFGDGLTNQLKHAWNVAPDDRFNAPTVIVGGGYLTLTYRRLKSTITPRPAYRVQVSADLQAWLDDTSPGAPHTTELSVVSLNAETELVTVRDNVPWSAATRRYVRLWVSHP